MHVDTSRIPLKYRKLEAAALEGLPTLAVGQCCDLKIDDGTNRVWLCRCGVEDGMPFDNSVTVEINDNGRWREHCTYEAV